MKISERKRSIILLCVGVLGVILVVWTVWGNTALMVNEISISSERLPVSFSGFRIAHLSDLHNTEFGLGRMFADGIGTDVDESQAQAWYAKALSAFRTVEEERPRQCSHKGVYNKGKVHKG